MHGATIKVIDAQQAKLTNIYKNTKFKLLKTNAALWYNKICKHLLVLLNKYVKNARCNNKKKKKHDTNLLFRQTNAQYINNKVCFVH